MSKFIPKVGEDCVFQGTRLIVTAIGEKFALVKTPFHDKEFTLQISELSSLKTPAELERRRVLKLVEDARRESSNGMWSSNLNEFIEFLYDKNMLVDPEQNVKPLSKPYALQEIGITAGNYWFMVEHGFIVQGGD